jgi:hypothetical protein
VQNVEICIDCVIQTVCVRIVGGQTVSVDRTVKVCCSGGRVEAERCFLSIAHEVRGMDVSSAMDIDRLARRLMVRVRGRKEKNDRRASIERNGRALWRTAAACAPFAAIVDVRQSATHLSVYLLECVLQSLRVEIELRDDTLEIGQLRRTRADRHRAQRRGVRASVEQ